MRGHYPVKLYNFTFSGRELKSIESHVLEVGSDFQIIIVDNFFLNLLIKIHLMCFSGNEKSTFALWLT